MSTQNAPTTIEKFVSAHLSQITAEPCAPTGPSRSSLECASNPIDAAGSLPRKLSVGAFGRGAIVFICGMAVGYVLSNQPEVFPLQAKTPERGAGAAGLRIDYDLRQH